MGFLAGVKTNKPADGDMELPHTKSVEEVLDHFSVKETEGLSPDEVARQRQKFGPNGEIVLRSRGAAATEVVVVCDVVCMGVS